MILQRVFCYKSLLLLELSDFVAHLLLVRTEFGLPDSFNQDYWMTIRSYQVLFVFLIVPHRNWNNHQWSGNGRI
jgi:hypothetical protein